MYFHVHAQNHPLLGHITLHFRGEGTGSGRQRDGFCLQSRALNQAPRRVPGRGPLASAACLVSRPVCSCSGAETSSRSRSGPATRTGAASPLCTTTTCSPAASWSSCSPSFSTCCGCGASTGGPRAAAQPPPSGWRRAFRPRRSLVPYEPGSEPPETLQEKPFSPQGFASSFSLGFVFLFPLCSWKQNQTPLFTDSAVLEVLRSAVLCTALNGGVRKKGHHFIFAA